MREKLDRRAMFRISADVLDWGAATGHHASAAACERCGDVLAVVAVDGGIGHQVYIRRDAPAAEIHAALDELAAVVRAHAAACRPHQSARELAASRTRIEALADRYDEIVHRFAGGFRVPETPFGVAN